MCGGGGGGGPYLFKLAQCVSCELHHNPLHLSGRDGAEGRMDGEHTSHQLLVQRQHVTPAPRGGGGGGGGEESGGRVEQS